MKKQLPSCAYQLIVTPEDLPVLVGFLNNAIRDTKNDADAVVAIHYRDKLVNAIIARRPLEDAHVNNA